MWKVEISSTEVNKMEGISAKSGKPYSIRSQSAWIFLFDRDGKPQPHPVKMRLVLEDNAEAYQPGIYCVCPSSLWIDKWGEAVLRPRLLRGTPAAVPAQPKAA